MTTTISLPSIKISKTPSSGAIGKPDPVTPVSDIAESPTVSGGGGGAEDNGASPNSVAGEWKRASRRDTAGSGLDVVDPVTLQIMRRTRTQNTIPKGLRNDDDVALSVVEKGRNGSVSNGAGGGGAVGAGGGGGGAGGGGIMQADTKVGMQMHGRDRKKGVSFLSRIIGSKKKGTSGDAESIDGDRSRMEGLNAHVFSQPIGYTPTFSAPPKYIRVHSHNKSRRDFNQTFLAQELYRPPIAQDDDGTKINGSTSSLTRNKTGSIWAMKFSKDGRYLAAAGQDKVVRVWQVLSTKEERETHEREEDAAGSGDGIYSGSNAVRLNAPVFRSHPHREYYGHTGDVLDLGWSKNNFLLSSSMDKTVRLWHVSRKECLCCFRHNDFVTSIAFHPKDDRFFLAGSLDMKLRLWSIPDKSVAYSVELPDLITAVSFTPDGRTAIAGCMTGLLIFYETEGLRYHTQLLVRSSHGKNSRGSKITGIETVILPRDDPNGEVKILVTSNDSRIRMYNARDKSLETKFKGYENTCSQIHASFSDDTRYVVSGSENGKVYIWNMATGEAEKKDKRPVEFFDVNDRMVTVAILAPQQTIQHLSTSSDEIFDLCNPPPVTLQSSTDATTSLKPTDNPSWVSRSTHPEGNIIATADYHGRIRIFRQDCAATKRRRSELWETSSTLSKKLGSRISRKGSLNSHSSDRISSWRQSISSLRSIDAASVYSHHRSESPGKTVARAARSRRSSLSRENHLTVEGGFYGPVRTEEEEEEEEEEGEEGEAAEPEAEVRCRKCGSVSFRAKMLKRGEHTLVCVECNTAI